MYRPGTYVHAEWKYIITLIDDGSPYPEYRGELYKSDHKIIPAFNKLAERVETPFGRMLWVENPWHRGWHGYKIVDASVLLPYAKSDMVQKYHKL
jgi:hypothetical protein